VKRWKPIRQRIDVRVGGTSGGVMGRTSRTAMCVPPPGKSDTGQGTPPD
jgi:hypothetical protein